MQIQIPILEFFMNLLRYFFMARTRFLWPSTFLWPLFQPSENAIKMLMDCICKYIWPQLTSMSAPVTPVVTPNFHIMKSYNWFFLFLTGSDLDQCSLLNAKTGSAWVYQSADDVIRLSVPDCPSIDLQIYTYFFKISRPATSGLNRKCVGV